MDRRPRTVATATYARMQERESQLTESSSKNARAVFVVHGRNESLRKSMFEFLRALDLTPIEWSHAVDLTAHASPYIGDVLDTAFNHAQAVVVLLTPDEVAYLQPRYAHGTGDPETQPAAQARPNVLFEAGMALGRDAARTVIVEVGEVRPFSDIAGRHVIRLNDTAAARQALAKRLSTAGCAVDMTGTDWLSTGDFTAPPPPGDGLALGRRVPSTASPRPPADFDVKYRRSGAAEASAAISRSSTVVWRRLTTSKSAFLGVPRSNSARMTKRSPRSLVLESP